MKKSALLVLILTARIGSASAQIYNFNKDGDKKTAAVEKVQLSLTQSNKPNALPALVLAGFTALVTVGVDAVKTAMDNRAQSYAATYNGMMTSDQVSFMDGQLGDGTLMITRKTSDAGTPATFTDQATITLKIDRNPLGGLFRLKLKELKLDQAKARITGSAKGKTIDLNVDVQITVLYRDGLALKSDTDKATGQVIQSITYTYKSASLGESSITAHGISPGDDRTIADTDLDNDNYSDWFQMIPYPTGLNSKFLAALKQKGIDPGQCWVTIKATVKEANPYGVKAQQLSDFFKNNSSDIADFFKAWIPSTKN